eukprot:scaffold29330_cov56-Attheya_sp.AAC.5
MSSVKFGVRAAAQKRRDFSLGRLDYEVGYTSSDYFPPCLAGARKKGVTQSTFSSSTDGLYLVLVPGRYQLVPAGTVGYNNCNGQHKVSKEQINNSKDRF